MWWCCGKTDKNNPGCKFSKHANTDQELFEVNEEQPKSNQYSRCAACKQLGHLIHECEKDPNFKTNA